ncbi:hypothetical protein T440DRAFT_523536 [Plenodomus tracheiphilus IPT5]|uniref:Cytochrome P450 n=1 Tax=Plenodomus tracheiphilus IPT5 TaxID=1408161 RepID=A0A6A7AQF0_9PLEO|nr:hypothetical protein T440DRAFT_523536 [Plenodomus tracheiphilus IPT5]
MFLGEPTCRDPKWPNLTRNLFMDLLLAFFALRMFPLWMQSFVKPFIPARWRVQRVIDIGTDVALEFMSKCEDSAKSDDITKEEVLFEWMVKNAVGNERSLEEMAARQRILNLAIIYTAATTVGNTLFDMIEYPEWSPVLTDEIEVRIMSYGEPGQDMRLKEWLQLLKKMDSFIIESKVQSSYTLDAADTDNGPITLRNRNLIPIGVRVAWAGPQHASDSKITPDPERFDPMRSYRKRHINNKKNSLKFTIG